ncbi:MAG: SHOCT domain-containing protein [bacterium]|nr:SHOCT domain-containing protein [bacterium]
MKCEKCGTEVKKGDKFCPDCGAEVSGVSGSQGAKNFTKPVLSKEITFCALAVVVIVILSIVVPVFSAIAIPLLLFIVVLTVCLKLWRKKKNRDTQEVEQQTLSDKEIQKLAQYFISRDEKFVSSLGNGYIMNYLINGSFSEGFSVITDKRVYFRGSCLSGEGKTLVKTNEERTVDIKDITGSGFIYHRYLSILITVILVFILLLLGFAVEGIQSLEDFERSHRDYLSAYDESIGIFMSNIAYDQAAQRGYSIHDNTLTLYISPNRHLPAAGSGASFISVRLSQTFSSSDEFILLYQTDSNFKNKIDRSVSNALKKHLSTASIHVYVVFSLFGLMIYDIIVLSKYLSKRKTLFRIEYAGGCIAFNVSYYAKAEIDDFQKQLRRAKDLAEESASKASVLEAPVQPAAAAQNSVPDDLRKYADLLKEGLISQEEYDAMKKKILGL